MSSYDLDELARLGTANLTRVIAIDSQSDERQESIPSSEGQRRLSEDLERFFGELGHRSTRDACANLIVEIPGKRAGAPLALMVHMDTSRGTQAVPRLDSLTKWDGRRIPYAKNSRLEVSVERYPETRAYLGHDLLFGPGERAFGLDDKLGMSQLMTMAQRLAQGDIAHGPLLLVFRPDEEIGRMQAVLGLAQELKQRGVRYGYTVDGLSPFEVNVENFHGARAYVHIEGRPLASAPSKVLRLKIRGAKSHGATAKAEGYKNATMIVTEAVARAGDDVVLTAFQSDLTAETDAEVAFRVRDERRLLESFEVTLAPHRFKGAEVEVLERSESSTPCHDAGPRLLAHLRAFVEGPGPSPLMSEDSEGRQGYSQPNFVHAAPNGFKLEYRLRDFDPEALLARQRHVEELAARQGHRAESKQIYANMGPRLAPYPELVTWARRAAEAAGETITVQPIRGSTGVDPFLDVGIPVANLGTGYFAPESEKELTSRQYIARHARWLCELVQRVGAEA